jgi:hypothetical protein
MIQEKCGLEILAEQENRASRTAAILLDAGKRPKKEAGQLFFLIEKALHSHGGHYCYWCS